MADPGPIRPVDAFFPERRQAILADVCATCSGPATEFTDEASEREYRISAMCQGCQDSFYSKSRKGGRNE